MCRIFSVASFTTPKIMSSPNSIPATTNTDNDAIVYEEVCELIEHDSSNTQIETDPEWVRNLPDVGTAYLQYARTEY